MNLIDSDYYLTDYIGEDPDDLAELEKLICRASDDINAKTGWQITDLSEYALVSQTLVKKATAAQVEFYVLNGEKFNDDGSNNVKIGKFSYGGSASAGSAALSLCARAGMYIEQSEFAFRGVDTYEQTDTY